MKKSILKIFIATSFLGAMFAGCRVHAATSIGGWANCVNKNGRAVCTPDYNAIRRQTGRVIVNGWVNYGPWQPRPKFGVIIP
ncbi:bacteriocin [Streptococcus saliviloxodontae]|jgi:hypothetical protein|uniref:Bacteriocin n=1 Tax=Streptococcus saliviloxodontae TaxID=1349416 RepID=A0ABS2PND8_9STRE|nr:bacteriocin [Streptococcus saliviloxodontae]MBM7636949.1 hypothetical protein [Streptococcus saliviloxodontae]